MHPYWFVLFVLFIAPPAWSTLLMLKMLAVFMSAKTIVSLKDWVWIFSNSMRYWLLIFLLDYVWCKGTLLQLIVVNNRQFYSVDLPHNGLTAISLNLFLLVLINPGGSGVYFWLTEKTNCQIFFELKTSASWDVAYTVDIFTKIMVIFYSSYSQQNTMQIASHR